MTFLMGDRFDFEDWPMSSTAPVLSVLAVYYTVILGGRELMKERQPWRLPTLFKLHNLTLTIVSGVLLVLHLMQVVPALYNYGLLDSICKRYAGFTDSLAVLYYFNYITKYIELFDTVFLVLRKKPLTFLHTYHHGATALLCYIQLSGRTPISWVPIVLNLAVHVVMYWYYFQAARGIKIWWKQYITILQIVQFVIDLGFIWFAFYTEGSANHWTYLNLPHLGGCEGDQFAAWWGVSIISSYLLLFISFYFATYKPADAGKAKKQA